VANPEHERRIGQLIAATLPDVEFTLSHRINRTCREYRRASATVIDASLKRLMRAHLLDVDRRLRKLGFAGEPLMVTHLSGGVERLDDACEHPIHTVDSGPALAPVAALMYADAEPELRDRDLLVVDAGGTSCDLSPTRGGRVIYTREKWLGPKWEGHMTGLPAVDTHSFGAGGGSLAWVDDGRLLRVGPASAGAVPGPACYDRGGIRPTVTDAAVVLGYLDPDYFLGGRVALRRDKAVAAIDDHVGTPLNLTVEAAADAILELYSEHLRSFISDIVVAQGLDPRESLLVAGGGSAGFNIVTVASELGVPQVLVPSLAAGLSAVGGQYSDLVATFSRGVMTSTREFSFGAVNAALQEITAEGDAFIESIGSNVPAGRTLYCEARYENQLWELDVPIGDRRHFAGRNDVLALQQTFDELHESVFAVSQPGEPVEVVAWRGDVRVPRARAALPVRTSVDGALHKKRTRMAHFGRKPLETRVWRVEDLSVDDTVTGPAIIDEPTTTIVLPPGASAVVRRSHYLIDVDGPTSETRNEA
jgi:N-methylhydantoinase A